MLQSIAQEIVDYMKGQDVQDKYQEMLKEHPLEEDDSQELWTYFQERVKSITSSVEDIVIEGDEEEFHDIFNSLWLELRLEWNRYNCQMQYQTMLRGEANRLLMAKGALLSDLAGKIEAIINASNHYWLVKIASAPVDSIRYRVKQSDKLITKTANYGQASQDIINLQIELIDHLDQCSDDKTKIQRFDSEIKKALVQIENTGHLDLREFGDCFESTVVKSFKSHEVPFQVSVGQQSAKKGVPPEIAKSIFALVEHYLGLLSSHSIEKSSSERSESGKSPFINLKWGIEMDEDRLIFTLEDDGLGALKLDDFETEQKNISGAEIKVEQLPIGNNLTIDFLFYSVHNFLVFYGLNDESFALPGSHVERVINVKDLNGGPTVENTVVDEREYSFKLLNLENIVDPNGDKIIVLNSDKLGRFGIRCRGHLSLARSKIKRDQMGHLYNSLFCGFIEKKGEIIKVLNLSKESSVYDCQKRKQAA